MEATGESLMAASRAASVRASESKDRLAATAKTLKLEAALFGGGMLLLMGAALAGCYYMFGRGGQNFSQMTMAGGTALAFLPALVFGGVVEVDLIRRYVNEYRPAKEECEKAAAESMKCLTAMTEALRPPSKEKQE